MTVGSLLAKANKPARRGYIYQIMNCETGKCYIGSTMLDVNVRFELHKSAYRRWCVDKSKSCYCSSFLVLESKIPKIITLDEIEFEDKSELQKLEDVYIEAFRGITTNVRYAHYNYDRYYKEKRPRIKQYYIDNSDAKKQYQKNRYNLKRELKFYNI